MASETITDTRYTQSSPMTPPAASTLAAARPNKMIRMQFHPTIEAYWATIPKTDPLVPYCGLQAAMVSMPYLTLTGIAAAVTKYMPTRDPAIMAMVPRPAVRYQDTAPPME